MGTLAIFLAASSLVLLIGLVLSGRKGPVEARLERVTPGGPQGATSHEPGDELFGEVPSLRLLKMLMPSNQQGRQQIGDRLVQAGFYKRNSYAVYITTKAILMAAPVAAGFFAGSARIVEPMTGLALGAIVSLFGMIVPSVWLDVQLRRRQTALKRALPDALDVIVICLEGGLSLAASFKRVSSELRTVHPMLSAEMAIVQREVQMGRSTGESLKNFAMRFDLEELRSMASVVVQAERFGSSVVKALRAHADSLRERRLFHAEELAQKAAIKILFPTLLFIFPTIFVVLLGPAAFDIIEVMGTVAKP
jgi:tight adherence protein C